MKLSVTDDQGNVALSQQNVTITVPDSDGDGINDDLDKCAEQPGPGPDGCPIRRRASLPAPIASSATAAGELGVTGALKSGVTVVLNCSDACTGVFTLTRARPPARRRTLRCRRPSR